MNPPRVVQVATSPVGGGAERIVRALAAGLAAHGFVSEAVYFAAREAPPEAAGGELAANETCLGCTSPRSPTALPRLRRYLAARAAQGPLIVHAHLTWPFLYVPLAARGLPAQLVYTEHSSFNRRRALPGLGALDRRGYRPYQRIYCISEGVREALVDWLGPDVAGRAELVANGARLFPPVPRPPPTAGLRLLSVGSLQAKKGFDQALAAIARAPERVARYTLIGDGPERAALQRQAAALGLADKVRLLGWQDDLPTHYAAADALLIPSRWEGFGLVAVEAMSAGLPVLAADVPGLREVVGADNPAGRLVGAGADAWAQALREFRPPSPAALAAGRRRAQRYSLAAMVRRYAEAYRRLLEPARGREAVG